MAIPGKRGPGRPRKTCDKCVKKDLKDCKLLASNTQNRVLWTASMRKVSAKDKNSRFNTEYLLCYLIQVTSDKSNLLGGRKHFDLSDSSTYLTLL